MITPSQIILELRQTDENYDDQSAQHSFFFLFVIAGRGLNLRPFLETFAPIYMPLLITTHPRTADLGKPRIVMIGGGAGGLAAHKEWKVSKTQNVRDAYSQNSPPLFVYPNVVSNPIASSFYTYIGRQKRFLNHLVEATPRLVKGIADKAARNTWRYLRQTGVNLYMIGNVISGKTPKILPGNTLNLHPRSNRLVWKFTLVLPVTNFLDKRCVRTGLTSYILYIKSNRLIIARLKGCAL